MVMAVGGTLGIASIGVPFVETGIALSVAVLVAMVAFNVIAPTATAIGFVGLFAIFHGHAQRNVAPRPTGNKDNSAVPHRMRQRALLLRPLHHETCRND
jgi:urease accessory protein